MWDVSKHQMPQEAFGPPEGSDGHALSSEHPALSDQAELLQSGTVRHSACTSSVAILVSSSNDAVLEVKQLECQQC